ncbi:MAG: Lrp/AsnC family transcriptional regulator [Acidimicrobiales bacterium]
MTTTTRSGGGEPDVDTLDASLVRLLTEDARSPAWRLARLLGVPRARLEARVRKLRSSGIVRGFSPDLDLAALGYSVRAIVQVEIVQAHLPGVLDALRAIPEVIEVSILTGPTGLCCRVVALDNSHLHELLSRMLAGPGVRRVYAELELDQPVPHRADELVLARMSTLAARRDGATA